MTSRTQPSSGPPAEPVVCTLTTKEAAVQALEWRDLRHAASHVTAIEAGVRMRFAGNLAARIDDLAQREATCCAFLRLTTTQEADEVVLEITTANPDGLPVISALAGIPIS